jgi:hypothetical protein
MRIRLDISDAQGNAAKWCGRIADELFVSKDSYRTLSPGESIHARLITSCDNSQDSKRGGYVLSAPGKYLIKAVYLLPLPREEYEKAFPNSSVVRGPISAEPVTVELK